MEHPEFFSSFAVLLFVFLALAVSILVIIAQWRIYEKAGQPGWASIIPFFNFYILLKIVGKPDWWLIWIFIPVANIVIAVWVTNLLSKSFGKDEGFTLGLLFLGFIFYPILGFGDAQYQGPAGKPKITKINV
jgi:hypothetical protein